MSQYSKLFAAVLAAAVSALVAQVIGGHITQVGLVNVVLAVLGAAVVYFAPNLPGTSAAATKAIMAGLTAGATILATLIGAGSLSAVTTSEWTQIGIAVLNTASVYFVKNDPAATVAAKTPAP